MAFARAAADLPVFIRQSHGDRDDAALAGAVLLGIGVVSGRADVAVLLLEEETRAALNWIDWHLKGELKP